MIAYTKRRCLCPKPDYVMVDITEDVICPKGAKVEFAMPLGKDILHWSTVTTECSRCGVPLCEDCGTRITIELHPDYEDEYYCPACAEEGR